LYPEYSQKGVAFLMTDFTEEGQRDLPQFLDRYRPAWPTGFCGRDPAMEFLQISLMNPGYVPKMTVIDRGGVIRAQYDGMDAVFEPGGGKILRTKLDEVLAMKAPPAAKPAAKAPSAKK